MLATDKTDVQMKTYKKKKKQHSTEKTIIYCAFLQIGMWMDVMNLFILFNMKCQL